MIHPAEFVSVMEKHWVEKLGNIPSKALRLAWGQLCSAFNGRIEAHGNPERGVKWPVLQLPTGTGKTQGLIVYASLLSALSADSQPGILAVTRLKEDADGIAAQINALSREFCPSLGEAAIVAVSHHTDNRRGLSDLQNLAAHLSLPPVTPHTH